MNDSEREFLYVLGYFFLQNNKNRKAADIFRALHALYPDTAAYTGALSYACLRMDDFAGALEYAEDFLDHPLDSSHQEFGFFLKSRALWGLGKEDEARKTFQRFYQGRAPS